MWRTRVSRPRLDNPDFATRWQELAADGPIFRAWNWVGCLAAERYPDPVLIETLRDDEVVGLALFNRRRTRFGTVLYLHESGNPALDAIFTEHNGVVAAPGQAGPVMQATLRAAAGLATRIVLSGIDDQGRDAVRALGGVIYPEQTRHAPYVTLDPGGPAFMDGLGRSTRALLRRSDRSYAATAPIEVHRAATSGAALAMLDEMLPLHRATWEARGIASPFLTAPVQRFHRALITSGVPAGAVEMLRITAGPRLIGILFNLRHGGRVAFYQGGLNYRDAAPHERPGLTCHHAAIRRAAADGAVEYDFLAGDARYKRNLADKERALHWLTWQRGWSVPGLVGLGRRWLASSSAQLRASTARKGAKRVARILGNTSEH